jgi:hypothetical protein
VLPNAIQKLGVDISEGASAVDAEPKVSSTQLGGHRSSQKISQVDKTHGDGSNSTCGLAALHAAGFLQKLLAPVLACPGQHLLALSYN